jgi:hypothetical protein
MGVKKRGFVLVVFALFLIVLLSQLIFAEVAGCYVYSEGSEDLYCVQGTLDTQAQEDCDSFPNCNMAESFLPGADCSDLDICKESICNADCQLHSKGKCDLLGGAAINDEEYDLWCSPGCCKISDKYCGFNLLKFECEDKAKKLGVFDITKTIFDNSIGMSTTTCQEQYCGITINLSNLNIIVKDQNSALISGAKIVLQGTIMEELSGTDGSKQFPQINPGTYSVKVSKEKYSTEIVVVNLPPGQTVNQEIILQEQAGIATVKGAIKDKKDKGVPGATISWTGVTSGTTTADSTAYYKIESLPAGQYTFTASKIGHKSQSKPYSVIAAGEFPLNFELEVAALQGVSGKTYLDTNNNKVFDPGTDVPKNDVAIYVDGAFKGRSQYPDGRFSIEITVEEQKEEHKISAAYLSYVFEEETFTISPGEAIENKILLLTTYIGECTEPDTEKSAENFTGKPVTGQKAIRLDWKKPCPEVIGYEIQKFYLGEQVDSISSSPSVNFSLDDKVEWGEEYTYKIITYYDKGRFVEGSEEVKVNVGNEECADRYNQDTGWETFCLIGNKELRKKVFTCNSVNKLINTEDCSEKDGDTEDYYCAPLSATAAECRDAGGCGIFGQLADPFGLYYSRLGCYGTNTPEEGALNYCYFDSTDTVVDQCNDCTKIDNCFDYNGKDSCEINNCLGSKCTWINGASNKDLIDYSSIGLPVLVTEETGAGYCIEEEYQEEDKCSLCSAESTMFENFYCTANVCSGLGQCFSVYELDECKNCGDSPSKEKNCYSYSTELECANGQNFKIGPLGETSYSEDSCGWERCFWDGQPNGFSDVGCYKDGNGDGKDDCVEFIAGEKQSCKIDNTPPKTKIVPEGISVISLINSNLTFLGDDSFHDHGGQKNKMGQLGICLIEADPNTNNVCDESSFVIFPYAGKDDSELVIVDLLNTSFLKGEEINGKTYKLKFYSEDKYFNREELKTAFLFVDNVVPAFEIKEDIQTSGDTTTLSVYLEKTSEIMACTFKLDQLLPSGESHSVSVPREEPDKAATFEDLKALMVNLTVTCVDDQGNPNVQSKPYTFDLEQNIDIIYPEMLGAVSKTEVAFKVETAVGATCSLYLANTNEKVADFAANEEGKVHETIPITGFIEGEYPSVYKVVCNELFDQTKNYEDYFQFTVDFTPPKTQIILTEGTREVKPLGFGWEEYFIETVNVELDCSADGFECDKSYYCLGEGCDFIGNEKFKEYTNSSVELTESTLICYYSTDLAENPVYQPECGNILIEGFGITLDKPELHYYLDEQWGIINKPVFDFQFFTKVPTIECRFDFSSGFSYDNTPVSKTRQINAEGKYLFEDFPTNVFTSYDEDCSDSDCIKAVYVKCKNLDEQIGPEQKIYLEYDKTAPEIIDAYADPDNVLEGITTELFVISDDKTLCKYSDISTGEGSSEYNNMEYSFSGELEKILKINHQDTFNLEFSGPKKEYTLATQCKNGASDLSEVEEIKFNVDYSQQGYIIPESLFPSGFVWDENVTISLQTSKAAVCSYDLGAGYLPFEQGSYTTSHSSSIASLTEQTYTILVKCVMGDHIDHETIEYTIDRSAPVITSLEDGNYSCGSEEISLMIYTNEVNDISEYIYELYDAGNMPNSVNTSSVSNTSSSSTGQMVSNGNFSGELPIKIATNSLIEGKTYKFKVKATDLAGNEGQFFESDGISIVKSNYSVCEEDKSAPDVEFVMNSSSCTSIEVELLCTDSLGCKEIKFGKHGTSSLCNITSSYQGSKLTFSQDSWLCYYVEDYSGNNRTDQKKIDFVDEDGDGVADSCDNCSGTSAGKEVNIAGCADSEVPEEEKSEDEDGDGLPDYWEKNYDAFDCSLNYAAIDSNDDGVSDNLEDYDSDGYSNYEEYTMSYNPCLADALVEILEEEISETQKEEEEEPTTSDKYDSGMTSEGSIIPLLFLIIGLLMVLGGIGYLVYYYKYSPAATSVARNPARPQSFAPRTPIASTKTQGQGMLADWKSKLARLKKTRDSKVKQRSRANIFGEFTKKSKEIPKVNELLSKKAPHLNKLQDLANHYSEHKEEIKSGLRPEEKSIFNKLENISKKTKEKKIGDVVSKDEAKDIFSKLKEINVKRKKK